MAEDGTIIEQYAEHLEQKAGGRVLRFTLAGGFVGALLGGFPLFYRANALVPSHLGYATLLLGALAGAYVGYTMGERRAVEIRMQARLALHQLQVEQSLIRGVARPAAPAPAPVAPAPIAPIPVAAPAPIAPAPVAPAPVAPAPVAPPQPPVAPVQPPVMAPAPVSPAPVSPAPAPGPAPAQPAPPPVTPAASLPRLVEPQAAPPLSSAG